MQMRFTHRAMASVILAAMLVGCGSKPVTRMGCLPFPGPLTLFAMADPDRLGTHHDYRSPIPRDAEREMRRGILYTCRGGFLDIAHVRNCIDWTRFNHALIHPAIAAGETQVILKTNEGGKYFVDLTYPDDWQSLTTERRAELTDELSLILAEQITLMMADWHEMITWHGYMSWIVIPENRSAFTYEDVISHMVGTRAAVAALRRPDENFNLAVTATLNEQLQSLGVVQPEQAYEAIDSVHDVWWSGGAVKKRYLIACLPGENVMPWIPPDLTFCAGQQPEVFTVPTLANVAGRDMSGFAHVEFQPGTLAGGMLANRLPDHPARIVPEVHFPQVLAMMAGEPLETTAATGDGPESDSRSIADAH